MRFVTTVPQQALFFLNSPFIAEQARHLAARTEAQASQPSQRVYLLYRLVFGRSPEKWETEAGLKFIAQGSDTSDAAQTRSSWQYGSGEFRADKGRVETFAPFALFVADRWQGAAVLPAVVSGKGVLRAAGGEPGEQPGQAVVRRWVSRVEGKLNIEGTLRHGQPAIPYGDGVRARIVSSRHGELASWAVNGSSAETKLSGIAVEKGDTIDFVVDSRVDPENDGFSWAPVMKMGEQSWNAKNDFSGPAAEPLPVWARYAQVLLQTNEFSFVD
jgi:hypothetical protein